MTSTFARHIIAGLSFLLLLGGTARAQYGVLNPGVRVGYIFGEGGGLTFGAELSHTWVWENGAIAGAVAAVDFTPQNVRIHFGAEGAFGIGVDLGPTVYLGRESDIGFSVTPFAGLFLYPYYSYTFRMSGENEQEVGAALKYPFRPDGGSLFTLK